MIITTIAPSNITLDVSDRDTFRFIKTCKVNRGCFRWLAVLLVFWPLLILYFFVGDTAYVVEINGKNYVVDEMQYRRLLNLMEGK
jgi:hypothetical protein